MTRQRRMILSSVLSVWVGLVLACTGVGDRKGGDSKPKPAVAASLPQKNKEVASLATTEKAKARAKARVKAEEEAEVQNEANLKAYQAEVENAKADYEKKQEKYKADNEACNKAMRIYQAAKAESEATKELNLARRFNNGKEMEIARRRFREIISRYPDTQAAKDAKILLNDGFVSARKTPEEPVPPVLPARPRLVLPPRPEPVAVVYPIDAEEKAALQAAEEAKRKQEERKNAAAQAKAEAERKAEEEYDADGLVLLRKTVNSFDTKITGTVVNRRSSKLRYAQITFNLYDASGAQVGTAIANINGLESGGRWNFTAISFGINNVSTYKFSELSGF